MPSDATAERIVTAALSVFLTQGVQKTSLADVAFQAGVTRVTLYRYFGDKRGLVREVCQRIGGIFQRAAIEGQSDSSCDIDARLNQLGLELNALPKGNLLARFEEIKRHFPEVYKDFHAARAEAVDRIFQQALAAAEREGTLREGLNLEVLKAVFWASVVGLLENPALISSNVSMSEIFSTVTQVFRHGILKESSGVETYGQQ